MTAQDLLDKINWEGGVLGAISYGISSDEVPAPIQQDWIRVESAVTLSEDIYDRLLIILVQEEKD